MPKKTQQYDDQDKIESLILHDETRDRRIFTLSEPEQYAQFIKPLQKGVDDLIEACKGYGIPEGNIFKILCFCTGMSIFKYQSDLFGKNDWCDYSLREYQQWIFEGMFYQHKELKEEQNAKKASTDKAL